MNCNQIVSEKVAGKNMLDSLNAPVYFFSFDHPGSFCNIIHNSPEYMTVLTLDQYYLKYTEKYLRRKAIFFPPGGEELEERYSVFDDFKTKKLKENKIDFSFFGTPGQGIDEMVKWFYDNSKDSFPVMKSFADHLKSETDQPSDEVFHHTLDEMTQIDTPLSDDEFASEFAKWVVFEKNISQTFRQKVVNQIVLSGMNFDLYGDGWEKELPFDIFNNETGDCGLRMHGSVPYDRVKDIYRQSWMSLNVMAWHKAGFTERIAEPQLAGSLVVTDSTEYLKKYYTDGEDIILFDLSDESIRELPNRLKALFSDKDRLLHMAWNGYQKALKYHTWDARVKQFLEITVDNT